MRCFATLLCLALLATLSVGDTVYLKNGKTYEGKVVSDSGGTVKFRTTSGIVMTLKRSAIDRIEEGRTAIDEYADRREKVDDDDIPALIELARWCGENKLYKQRKSLFRQIRKVCPDHPEARREMGQWYTDGKWKKAPRNLKPLTVEPGERQDVAKTRASLTLPKGWTVKAGNGTVTATGPARYATPPVLTVEFVDGSEETAAPFVEKEGWAKPEEVKVSGFCGHCSRRQVVADLIARAEHFALLTDGSESVRVRLTCLVMEEGDYSKAVEQTIGSLEFKAPPADYTNAVGKFSLNLPKPKDKWDVSAEGPLLTINHKVNEATDVGRFLVLAGSGSEELEAIQALFTAQTEMMKATGDMTESEIRVGGETGKLLDGTFLMSGIPARGRVVLIQNEKRNCFIFFIQHEYGQEKTNSAWDTIIKSFRFTD